MDIPFLLLALVHAVLAGSLCDGLHILLSSLVIVISVFENKGVSYCGKLSMHVHKSVRVCFNFVKGRELLWFIGKPLPGLSDILMTPSQKPLARGAYLL